MNRPDDARVQQKLLVEIDADTAEGLNTLINKVSPK
jgi:hypothetical protein